MYSEAYAENRYGEHGYDEERPRLRIINCVDLVDTRYDRIDWVVDGLLKPGLSVLAGAPKIGKSWMVLQLCMAVAKGEPFLGMNTHSCGVLYITLEDSEMRLQDRILRQTDQLPERLNISLNCPGIGEQLKRTIAVYCGDYPSTRLVVIDTFQKIREQAGQMSYAGDYADVSSVKQIADELNISILLVHHTRKMSDSDVINEISGTNGIAGSADTLMILKKEQRSERTAVLSCTGRDIEDRMMELNLDRETCVWQVINDTYQAEQKIIPPQLLRLIVFAGKIGYYEGSNTEFCERFSEYTGETITPNHLKRLMNLYRYELEDAGVFFISVKRNGIRRLAVYYKKREDGVSQSEDDAEEEAALWEEQDAETEQEAVQQEAMAYEQSREHGMDDLPPTPTDDDAPPERRPEREF